MNEYFNSIRKIIARHFLCIILSILTGIVYLGPNLYFINSEYYAGLPMMYTDAEPLYLTRINAVPKGCVLVCNPFIKEYKSLFPFFDPSLSEVILAAPGMIFGIPTHILKVIYEFFFPALLFIFVYSLVFRLCNKRSFSLIAAMTILLGQNLINSSDLINFYDISELFKFNYVHHEPLVYSRLVNPQLSSLYLFSYFHILLSLFKKADTKSFVYFSIISGLSFYVYFFTYAFICSANIFIFSLFVWKKEWRIVKKLATALIIAFIIALPQLINIYNLLHHAYLNTIFTHMAPITHFPHISLKGVILLLVFLVIFCLYKRKVKNVSMEGYFMVAIITACFIVRNEHILIGRDMQYFHFERYFFDPIFILAGCFYIKRFIFSYNKTYQFIFFSLWLPFLFFNASLIQYRVFQDALPGARTIQKYVPLLNWLREKIPPQSILAVQDNISDYIPLYTDHYELWNYMAGEWISIPGRIEDINSSRESARKLEIIGNKYGVDYFIEDKKTDFFLRYPNKLEKVYEDGYFTVYKAHP